MAAIAAEKRAVRSPAQIVKDLPNQIPMPVPIVIQNIPSPGQIGSEAQGAGTPRLGGLTLDKTGQLSNDASKLRGLT